MARDDSRVLKLLKFCLNCVLMELLKFSLRYVALASGFTVLSSHLYPRQQELLSRDCFLAEIAF